MKFVAHDLIRFRIIFSNSNKFTCFSSVPPSKARTYSTLSPPSLCPLPANGTPECKKLSEGDETELKDTTDCFRRWGCSDAEISKIFHRRPSLRNADANHIKSKLDILSGLGVTSSHLIKMIHCRPKLLSYRISQNFDERIGFLLELFGSREMLSKAITRNPSLLTYNFHKQIKPAVALYEELGVLRKELVTLLLTRPTIIGRTTMNDEKMEYIRRTGLSTGSKMYKYVVTLIAVSRLETIQEKFTNFEKYGFTENDIFALFGRSPLMLTLSVDKVQRNMTFVLGTMKLPANVILDYPFLLHFNLECTLRPRFALAGKIQEMGVRPEIKGSTLFRALRMTEERFLKAFVKCHPEEVAEELMEFYIKAKDVKRLAEASKKNKHGGFPF